MDMKRIHVVVDSTLVFKSQGPRFQIRVVPFCPPSCNYNYIFSVFISLLAVVAVE